MTAWTRIGSVVVVLYVFGFAALAPAAERPLSDAQLNKINGWIAEQGRDIAISPLITEILGLTRNDETLTLRGYAALDRDAGNEIHQIFVLPERKGYLAVHFHQDRVEVYLADKDLALIAALGGVRGGKPAIMLFQEAQAGFGNELTWWAHFADKN